VSEPLGCGLIETPGKANVHGLPSLPSIARASNPPPAAFEETAAGFEDDRRRGETELGQFRGEDAAFACAACMKRLRHGAEILAQPRGLARGKPQRAPRAFAIEAEQVSGARGGAERADGRGRVKPF